MQLAINNNVDNPTKAPDSAETYTEDNRNDNIQEQLLLNNNTNFIYTPDTSERASDIYTGNNKYVGSLEENVPGVLTELIPMQIFNNFENMVNCCDNLTDSDVILNSETQFIEIDKSCTIKNALIQDKENLPSDSYLGFSNSDLHQQAIEEIYKLKPNERFIADVDDPNDPDYVCDNQSDESKEMDSGSKFIDKFF